MSKTKKNDAGKISPKKNLQNQIADQLTVALNGTLKDLISEKKLNNRIKKAARLLTEGIKVKPAKKSKAKKQTVKDTEVVAEAV